MYHEVDPKERLNQKDFKSMCRLQNDIRKFKQWFSYAIENKHYAKT